MARRLGRLAAASTAAVVMAAAGACTSDPNEAAGTASTKGLTEDTIRIGVIGADFGQLSEIGLAPDLGDQEVSVQAFVDEINEDGGIDGRRIELRQTLIDGAGGGDAGQAACLEMTEEFGAFAVIVAPAVPRDVARCTAVTNQTLTIAATGFDRALYEEAGGLLFSAGSVTSMSTDRQYEGWAQIMHDEGLLDGRTIGVVTSENTPEFVAAAEDALVPTLEDLGYEVAAEVVLPCPELDPDCEQHEAAVQQLKDAQVDFVFMAAANIAGPTLLQAAQNLQFTPQWAANGNQVTDTVSQFFDPVSAAWDGTIGTSTVFALPEDITPAAQECNEVVATRTDEQYEAGSDAFGFTAVTCLLFRIVEDAASDAEGGLDQATMVEAIEGLGDIELNAGPDGSLSADKHDAGDHLFLCDYRAEARECVQRPGEPIEIAG
ncbi:MAG TPA: ABC transporter substrate-binding protein [Acidimicrobiales bacterium]|nr:ABC transporter substrate-binding protein [Acidimicrobiales bacterium]